MARVRKRSIHLSKLCSFSCCGRPGATDEHARIGQKGYSRVVYCNDADSQEQIRLEYRGNYVSTTKYTAANFIPKSLFEQFRRVANVYFLVVACVSFSPLAPYSGPSILAPLVIVIGATIAKEGIEDWHRRSQDIEANNRKVEVFDGHGCFKETKWKDIRVGDLVKVCNDEYFPADLLLLSSYYDDGVCYVETMNLDGETNLKSKHALEVTSSIRDVETAKDFRAVIKCEDPNEHLYSFVGTLYYECKQYALSPQQILLRGSKLKHTDYIYGVVIFTGHDTKVMQNAVDPPSKRTRIERTMDKIFYILFSALVLVSFVGSVVFGIETKKDNGGNYGRWYLRPDSTTVFFNSRRPWVAAFLHFLTALMLYGYLIPISLYVSIEICKVLQSIFINQDQAMYDEETERPAHARTSNLNEELGQVYTILSDKTGTLTCNSMEFVKCSIAGTAYGRRMTEVEVALARKRGEIIDEAMATDTGRSVKGFNFQDERIMKGNWVKEPHPDIIQKFFRVLATCHTAVPHVTEPDQIVYEAESTDEVALAIAAREVGFKFFSRNQTGIQLHELDPSSGERVDRFYKILHVLEFSSARRRMSVIVRNPEKQILLLSKGADSVMFERLSEHGRMFEVQTKEHIERYSEAGLRTLVVAYRELDDDDGYKLWEEKYVKAKTSVSADRDNLVDELTDMIERDFILLGATAVEDKLQKGVPSCIDKLARAGIRIWVLTGDKKGTAINIGYACGLLRHGMRQIVITLELPEIEELERKGDKDAIATASLESVKRQIHDEQQSLESVKRQIRDGQSQVHESLDEFGLIIDGNSLYFALDENLVNSFMELAMSCATVICCRSSPKQKAVVTRLVKSVTSKTTLAIGDGANDVGMIQEADIGVGISGVEGMQAVMSSDFSIAQFRFLERLLLVHGHWCYRRIAKMICYFFYKNIAFGFTLFWFEAYTSFSAQPAYNDWYMSCYNVFFTSLPGDLSWIGTLANVIAATSLGLTNLFFFFCKHPSLYQEGVQNILFSWIRILGWMFNGVLSSITIFFLTSNSITGQAFRNDGQVADYSVLGLTMYTCVVLTVNCQMALSVNYFTWIQHLFIWGSIALWFIFLLVYGSIPQTLSTTAYQVFIEACAPSIRFWLTALLVVIATLMPLFSYKAFQIRFRPMKHDMIQAAGRL